MSGRSRARDGGAISPSVADNDSRLSEFETCDRPFVNAKHGDETSRQYNEIKLAIIFDTFKLLMLISKIKDDTIAALFEVMLFVTVASWYEKSNVNAILDLM